MNKKTKLQKVVFFCKEYKVLTYASLLFLTITTNIIRKDYNDLQERFYQNETKLAQVEALNKSMVKGVVYYNNGLKFIPMASWKKKKVGSEFIGNFFNKTYVEIFGHQFGHNANNLIGRNNFQLGVPKSIAQRYYENDVAVAITGRPMLSQENYFDSIGRFRRIDAIKWRELRGIDTLVNGMVLKFYPFVKEDDDE
tara:strand:+ start:434 stop:1021 length:588 start_codon:yes stop_codon:yes gene_type:complete